MKNKEGASLKKSTEEGTRLVEIKLKAVAGV
jgi:hypothetical protein